ncbi:MAG: BMP family ABC transporter substrate-binding protein [Burkholderiaceae bacterium]
MNRHSRCPRPATVFALAAVVVLSACGKEPPAPKPATQAPAPVSAASPATPAPAPAAAATPSTPAAEPAAAKSPAPLKAAWVYVGPVGDGGWTFAHDNARKAVAEKFGDGLVTTFVESVPESADAERVLRDLAEQGNTLIFGTTFSYMEPMLKLSKEFPNVRFEHATGYKTAPNMSTYDSRTYQGAYLAGIIAGSVTQSKQLGVVGSIPIPEVLRNINAFTLGAQSMNPEVTTRVVWVNKWFDPPRETEAAQSLLDQGADVLFQNTDSSAVLQTAEKAGKSAFGWDSDMTAYGPKAHLASAIIKWAPYYGQSVSQALDGTWKSSTSWWGVDKGAIDIVSIADRVPEAARVRISEVKAGLIDGSYKIWKGPILDNTGREVIAAGQVADDAFLGGLNFYVKGVEGRVPGGK